MRVKPPNLNADIESLAAEVLRLSRMLTRERDCLPHRYLKDPGLRKAYLEYFLPANEAKIHLPLAELLSHPDALAGKAALRVLDVGTGPGTSMLGLLGFYASRERQPHLAFTAADRVQENLVEAERLVRERSAGTGLRTIRASVEELPRILSDAYDLIIFSNVLNELFIGEDNRVSRRVTVVGNILRTLLADDGSCIIIEPALRETSRDLLLLRDGLLREGLHVFSPCLMQDHCPALTNPKDWCHEDLLWEPSERIRAIDRRIGLRKDSLKFSYLVLRKDALSLAGLLPDNSFRVVSEPLVSRGKRELFLCGPGGRRLVTRLDKDRSAENEGFGALKRGMVVSFTGLLGEPKRFRVAKETSVAIFPTGKRETADHS
jgi:ribosomal protein RSM22 (predicted rRNA methylase)